MIRILNKYDEVIAVLSNDGGPNSCPYWDDLVHEKLNDSYGAFEFKAPADHDYSEFLVEENKAAVNDFDGVTRLFRIRIAEDVGEGDEKSRYIWAENEALELLGKIIRPQKLAGYTASQALNFILEGTRWEPGVIDWAGVRSPNFDNYVTAIEAIHTTRSQWGSDLRYRVEIDHNKIVGRFVDLPERVGEDNGKRFEYGKDLEGVKRTVNSSEVYTAMIGVGKSNEDKTFTTIAPVDWRTTDGDPADKPAGQDWIGDPEALDRWGVEGRHNFGVYRNDTIVDPELLTEYTWNALQKAKNPHITFEAKVRLLERLEGYGHEKTRTGDTIRIMDNTYAPALLLEARVIEYKWSLSDPEKDEVVIGDYRPQLTNSYQILKDLQSAIQVNAGAWDAITKTYTGDLPPENPEPDTIWLDTSGDVDVYKRWDAATGQWIPASPQDVATRQELEAVESTANAAAADAAAAEATATAADAAADQAAADAAAAQGTANTANQTANTANQTANTANQTANAAWGKFSGAGNTLPAGNVEFNFAGSATKGGNANNTDKVGTETAANVQNTSINFNKRNDRINTTPANPTINADGSAIDHVINKDSTANISFEWNFTGTGNAYDIDGFIVYIRQQSASTAYTFGTMPGDENVFYVTPEKRAFILYGVTADQYYTFGVQAYRQVDQDINASGFLKSAIVKSTAAGENPYRPTATLAFAGTITGTINGKTPAEVTAQELNAKTAVQNGEVALPTGALSGEVNVDQNAVKSIASNITFSRYGIEVADPAGGTARSSMTSAGFNSKQGAFTLEDPKTGQKYSMEVKQNLIHDHSFELLTAGAAISNANGYYDVSQSSESGAEDNWERWWSIGARLNSIYNTDGLITAPFGSQAVAVNNASYVRQTIDVSENRTFTVSAHFYAPNFTQTATGMPRIQVDFLKTYDNGTGEITTNLGSFIKDGTKPLVNYLNPDRLAITVTAPPVGSTTGLLHYRMRITIIGQNAYFVECDGVQVVENAIPVQYDPQNELFALRRGSSGGKSFVPFIDAPEKAAVLDSLRTMSMYYMMGNSEVAKIIGNDFAYFGYYPVGEFGGRKAWTGYGSSTLAFKTFSYHDIQLQPNGGGTIFTFDQVTNGGITFGQTKLKLHKDSATLHCRNAADTAWGGMAASTFSVQSDPATKVNIQPAASLALEKIKATPIYNYQLDEEFNIYEPYDVEEVIQDRKRKDVDRIKVTKFRKAGRKDPSKVKKRTGLMITDAPPDVVDGDGVDLYSMISLAWKAQQETAAINEQQQKQINDLTARVKALEDKINSMQPPAR